MTNKNKDIIYSIALTLIPGLGNVNSKKIVAYLGGLEPVFDEKKKLLLKVPNIGETTAKNILENREYALEMAEKEVAQCEKEGINIIHYFSKAYPYRLKNCEDAPLALFTKGNIHLNKQKVVSIVGTRKATDYGKSFCEKLIEDLKPHNPLIVSGLAYGIDIFSHRAALANNLPTIAVLAHGLDHVYPQMHYNTAKKMMENGGLVSDFRTGTNPDKENFPKRNRIIAGLADLTIVIESSKKGGSLITAEYANAYNRDVFALPGRINDEFSEGCNRLIKTHKAFLLESVKDIEYIMGWEKETENTTNPQTQLLLDLTPEEEIIVNQLKTQELPIDDLAIRCDMPVSKTASVLLTLELKNIVKSLPGKLYKIN